MGTQVTDLTRSEASTAMAATTAPTATEVQATLGLTHLRILRMMDASGLSPWLLGLGTFLTLTIVAVVNIIIARVPDPAMYRNSIAFTAIISFFLLFYFLMGRGWHRDVVKFLEFDPALVDAFSILQPGRRLVLMELTLALVFATTDLRMSNIAADVPTLLAVGIWIFHVIEYTLIILCGDIVFRQLVCIMKVARNLRIDLLNSDFYSTLANVMVRHIGLYIFGLCIISLSYIVFSEGTIGAPEMLVVMMPWYLPGLIIISLYLIPYNHFRHRMRSRKYQELGCIAGALAGNLAALEHSLLREEQQTPSKVDLLYYQSRIRAIREWPFTDKIRSLVLFGILPPLTWVIAALIEVVIADAL